MVCTLGADGYSWIPVGVWKLSPENNTIFPSKNWHVGVGTTSAGNTYGDKWGTHQTRFEVGGYAKVDDVWLSNPVDGEPRWAGESAGVIWGVCSCTYDQYWPYWFYLDWYGRYVKVPFSYTSSCSCSCPAGYTAIPLSSGDYIPEGSAYSWAGTHLERDYYWLGAWYKYWYDKSITKYNLCVRSDRVTKGEVTEKYQSRSGGWLVW